MSFKAVKIGTRQGLFNDGGRVHIEPRKTKASRREE